MSMCGRKPTVLPRQSGVSLIELMVALVIGLFLILGAVTVYSQSRNTYRTIEAVARLQETARYAFDVLEPDVRMASYWGLASRPDYIINNAGPTEDTPADLAAAETVIDACGNNWVINLDEYISGWNGPDDYSLGCAAYQDDYRAGTDGLIVRRGAEDAPAALVDDRLYIQSSRIQGTMFIADGSCTNAKDAACIPSDYSPPASETRELITTAYYISDSSVGRADVPALRRKRLVTGSILDEEVVSGVEDLQVRFGIDTNGDTNADTYVDPKSDPAAYGGQIVAATIWLRVRAEEPDFGFADDRAYMYADVDEAASNDNFRRIVVSRTISLRNKRT
jgi:type IV pilus assembly protein PilW